MIEVKPLSLRLLRWFCPPHLLEEIEGDLIQKFEKDLMTFGERRAKRRLMGNALRFFRPGVILRNKVTPRFNQVDMLNNNLKIGIRSLLKRKAYSAINILGLTIGMMVCFIVGRYIEFELSYDSFNEKAKNIYRVTSSIYSHGEQWSFAGYDLAPSLFTSIPEIKTFSRKHSVYGGAVVRTQSSAGERIIFREKKIQFVDSTFLDVFTFEMINGNAETALDNPSSAVITESIAKKYFGDANPIGKSLKVSAYGDNEFVITAVVKDVPSNSHFIFDILLTMHNLLQSDDYRGHNERFDNFITYIELQPEADLALVESKMQEFLKGYLGDSKDRQEQPSIKLQSLLDIHLQDHFDDDTVQRGGVYISELWTFIFVAAFVMIIAWINYINLSTARAMERAKEVSIRKVIGVLRLQLIGQFFTESALINLVALILAMFLAYEAMPVVNEILGKQFHFDFGHRNTWVMPLTLFIIGVILSGIYPSVVLSSFKVSNAMMGSHSDNKPGFTLRQGLVIFQFSASLVLIIGSITAFLQMRHMENHKRGYDSEQMLIVEGPSVFELEGIEERIISFKNEIKKISSVVKACTSDAVPGQGYNWGTHMHKKGALRNEIIDGQNIDVVFVDTDFPDTYGFNLKSGKIWPDFSGESKSSLLINDATIQSFYLGSELKALDEILIFTDNELQIAGVVDNYNWYSLKSKFTPMVFWPQRVCIQKFSIKINGGISQSIDQIEKLYKTYFDGNPFEYYFLDEKFNKLYESDRSFGNLVSLLSAIAIIISCLGLFGLVSFTILQKSKEICIRKVLGASVNNILSMLSWQFMKPLLIGSLVAIPLAWFSVNNWLHSFAFHIDFSWGIFIVSLSLLILIAIGTISIQTIRAAVANPAKGLKAE